MKFCSYGKYVFMDIGCGKGRVLLLAGKSHFKQIIGLEFSPTLAGIARANLERHQNIEVVRAVVCEYDLPREPLVLFLFNPFVDSLFERFISRVEASLRAAPRPLYLIYKNPICEPRLMHLPTSHK